MNDMIILGIKADTHLIKITNQKIMKRLLLILVLGGFINNVTAQQLGTFKDPRDGKTYKTTTIGTQTWMAENLAYKQKDGVYSDYDNNPDLVKYGYLYEWQSACKVCPTGWHLPSDAEWTVLVNFSGGEKVAGIKIKAKTDWGDEWEEFGYGTDDFGFSALPGGGHLNICDCYNGIFSEGNWWTSTQTDNSPFRYGLSAESEKVTRGSSDNRNKYSVRCLKD
jgi:uncharacterized protein (TIGR02145 family)